MRKMIQLLLVTITISSFANCKKDNYQPVTVADPKTHLLGKWKLIKSYKHYPEEDAKWKDVSATESYTITFDSNLSFEKSTSIRTITGSYYFEGPGRFVVSYSNSDTGYGYTFYFTRSDKLVLEYDYSVFDNQGKFHPGIARDLLLRIK